MRVTTTSTIALLGTLLSVLVPLKGRAVAQTTSPVTVTATPLVGAEAVRIAGIAPAGQPLEATLYAHFSENLPTVLLSRNALAADAAGHFNTTLSIAPAFFRDAIVTVVIRTLPAGLTARTTFAVGAPNTPAPPDEWSPSTR
jgi:hypothetical protein